jgi:hypothetical protein
MPRLTLAVLLVLISAIPLAPAAPAPLRRVPRMEPLYFPTRVGAEWVYEDHGHNLGYAVTKVEEKDGTTLVSVGIYQSNGRTTQHSHTVEVSKAGLRETLNANRKVEPPTPLLKLPCAKGDKWEVPFSLNGEKRGYCSMTVGGVEEVKVPAGTFRAVRVETVCTNAEKNVICTSTSWYAPGVGLVRYAYDNGSTRDLISFTPGEAAPAKK